MRYELILLKHAQQMKRSASLLEQLRKSVALSSYISVSSTMVQLREIERMQQNAHRYQALYDAVVKALEITPKGSRTLLVVVYFKNIKIARIAQKYGVSKSTVYRKLLCARNVFLRRLISLGYTEDWLITNYGDLELSN